MAKYRISSKYCFHHNEIVLMYFLNGIPFTFDDLEPEELDDPLIKYEAEDNLRYTAEDLYKASSYLMVEECHPCLFEVPLENPEDFPD